MGFRHRALRKPLLLQLNRKLRALSTEPMALLVLVLVLVRVLVLELVLVLVLVVVLERWGGAALAAQRGQVRQGGGLSTKR